MFRTLQCLQAVANTPMFEHGRSDDFPHGFLILVFRCSGFIARIVLYSTVEYRAILPVYQ